MSGWWERHPKAWAREQAALDDSGYRWERDQAALAAGRMVLRVQASQPDAGMLIAEFPATYPYFPPQVTLGSLPVSRHQHPFGRNLCLLARDGEEWQPGVDTLAGLLDTQLPQILAIDAKLRNDEEFVAAHEDHVGEPLSLYLPYRPESCVIVPDGTPPQDQLSGRLAVRSRPSQRPWNHYPFVAAVGAIQDAQGRTVIGGLEEVVGFSESVRGFWMRLASRPEERDVAELAHALVRQLVASNSGFDRALRAARKGTVLVAGFVYPDEIRWRETGDDWIFLVIEVTQEVKKSRPVGYQFHFVRADWGGEDACMRRAPFLQSLRDKTVLIVGLGSLGSPVALQLARAGVRTIDLVDHDHLQVGNTVRWALGWQYVGLSKVHALAAYLHQEYPRTDAKPHVLRIGAPVVPPAASDDEVMRSLLARADLVIDASANFHVSHYLADLCSELSKPYLWLTTTHGAAGGIAGRIVPGRTKGCWHCFQHRLGDRSIRLPAAASTGDLQAAGCSMPTFVGAGVDSDAIPVLAARLAIATLCLDAADGYPDFPWDVAVVDTYRGAVPMAPEWSTYALERHENCQACAAA